MPEVNNIVLYIVVLSLKDTNNEHTHTSINIQMDSTGLLFVSLHAAEKSLLQMFFIASEGRVSLAHFCLMCLKLHSFSSPFFNFQLTLIIYLWLSLWTTAIITPRWFYASLHYMCPYAPVVKCAVQCSHSVLLLHLCCIGELRKMTVLHLKCTSTLISLSSQPSSHLSPESISFSLIPSSLSPCVCNKSWE